MRIEVGGTRNYSEAPRRNELAVIDVTDPNKDKVVVIPESLLAKGGEIRTPSLPFALRVEADVPFEARYVSPRDGHVVALGDVAARLLLDSGQPLAGLRGRPHRRVGGLHELGRRGIQRRDRVRLHLHHARRHSHDRLPLQRDRRDAHLLCRGR